MGAGRPSVGERGGVADVPDRSGTGGEVEGVSLLGTASAVGVVASIGFFGLCRRPFRRLRRLAPLLSRSTEAGTMEVGRGPVVLGGSGRLTIGG